MGLFTKKETTHFERDESGRVVKVIKGGGSKTPISDKLLKQSKSQKSKSSFFADYTAKKKEEKKIFQEEFKKARMSELKKQARSKGRQSAQPIQIKMSMPSLFEGTLGMNSNTGTTTKKRKKTKKKKKRTSSSSKNNDLIGFDPVDNFGFL